MPLFSILMANYNNGNYIETAIQSVQSQTFFEWELIIVDDASDDDSVQRIKKFLGDQRIRLFVQPRNCGYTKVLIFGLKNVSSSIAGILDSDDALVNDAIEKAYAVHTQRPDVGLVLSQVLVCDSNLVPLCTTATTPEHIKEPLLWMRGSTAFRSFKMAAYARTPDQ
jgi:glycosyltransferase involved in cell wall biosynthesis